MSEKFINRRDVIKSVGAATATGIGLSSVGSVSARGTEQVTKKTARTVAKNAVDYIGDRSEFDDWRAQGVKQPQLYYGKVESGSSVEYVPRAWVFAVENGGDDVGYVAIDAQQLDVPVLAYGKSVAPHKRTKGAEKVARANGTSVHSRFIYQGGVEFGIETTDRRMVDLRDQRIKHRGAVKNAANLKPTTNPQTDSKQVETEASFGNEKENAPNWSGSTDGSISGVPNWTDSDGTGASSTNYGSGDDTWDAWDGCTPIAASMAIGYHENIAEWESNAKDALIDRLHVDMDTSPDGITSFDDVASGIDNYAEGNNSYNGNTNQFEIKGNVRDAVGNNNPPVLNMSNGPYTKDDNLFNGHSVCVVGYREENCGILCSNFYHKVHNGYNESPDRVSNGNWTHAWITRIKPE